ncbi:MAG: hypothetical protein RRZ72_03520 [Victivallaceae bacterium]
MSLNSVSQPLVVNESTEVKKSFGVLKLKVYLFLILGFCLLITVGVLLGFLPMISFNFIFILVGLLCLSLLFLGLACAYRFSLLKIRQAQERIFRQAFEARLQEAESLEYDLEKEIKGMVKFIRNIHRLEAPSSDYSYQKIPLLAQRWLQIKENIARLEKDCCDCFDRSVVDGFLGVASFDKEIKVYLELIDQLLRRTKKLLNLVEGTAACLNDNQVDVKAMNLRIESFERLLEAKLNLIKLYEKREVSRHSKKISKSLT